MTLGDVVQVSAGAEHNPALLSEMARSPAWGAGEQDQHPRRVSLGVTAVAAGGDHSLALKSDGTVAPGAWTLRDKPTRPPG